jgi:hypothetical protein
MNFWMKRVWADEDRQKEIETEVRLFLLEAEDKLQKLRDKFGG